MNILVVGSGGREHALCRALRNSPLTDELYAAPGNGGMAQIAQCVAFDGMDNDEVIDFCQGNDIGFVLVGPEAPLVGGLVDALDAAGIASFGPSGAAAMLEGSKGFMKDICRSNNIPTAEYERFNDAEAARAYVRDKGAPIVIKADGLAAGKGVILAQTEAEAIAAIDDIFGGMFGAAGAEIVIEEFLTGEEASFFVLTDGTDILPLATAQDHKAAYDGDTGPNTGGMGAYSPAPVMSDEIIEQTIETIIKPTVRAMKEAGTPFKGVLFAGLMITDVGPKLIEYNVRFGDPECQVLMARLQSDLLPILLATHDGTLDRHSAEWRDETALVVVMAANGYPGAYEKGSEIKNVEAADALPGVTVIHAGTAARDGKLLATGGRVLGVTALGPTVAQAQKMAYKAVDVIDWPSGFCRSDIGWRAIARMK